MSYRLKFAKQFLKDFAKLDSIMQSRVLVVLESMKEKPFSDCKKLHKAKAGIFRRRIGDYRLRFDVLKRDKMVYLYRFRHRKDIYKV